MSRRLRLPGLGPVLTIGVLLAIVGTSRALRADDGAEPKKAPDAEPKRAADLVEPTAELAPHLAAFDGEAEPGRELKRALVAVVNYLLVCDVDRAVQYFHPDLQFHVGA